MPMENDVIILAAVMSNAVLQHFKSSNAIEICNGIMLDSYLGLPHIHTCIQWSSTLTVYSTIFNI